MVLRGVGHKNLDISKKRSVKNLISCIFRIQAARTEDWIFSILLLDVKLENGMILAILHLFFPSGKGVQNIIKERVRYSGPTGTTSRFMVEPPGLEHACQEIVIDIPK